MNASGAGSPPAPLRTGCSPQASARPPMRADGQAGATFERFLLDLGGARDKGSARDAAGDDAHVLTSADDATSTNANVAPRENELQRHVGAQGDAACVDTMMRRPKSRERDAAKMHDAAFVHAGSVPCRREAGMRGDAAGTDTALAPSDGPGCEAATPPQGNVEDAGMALADDATCAGEKLVPGTCDLLFDTATPHGSTSMQGAVAPRKGPAERDAATPRGAACASVAAPTPKSPLARDAATQCDAKTENATPASPALPNAAPLAATTSPTAPQAAPPEGAASATRTALVAALGIGAAPPPLTGSSADAGGAWQVSLREPGGVAIEVRATRPAASPMTTAPPAWTLAIASPTLNAAALMRHAPRLDERLRARSLAHVRIENDDEAS